MFRKIIYSILLISPALTLACTSDFDCGYGNKCVQPQGAYGIEGTCVTPTNDYGQPQPDYSSTPSVQPHKMMSCQFNTDCNIGYSCIKRDGELYGICMK